MAPYLQQHQFVAGKLTSSNPSSFILKKKEKTSPKGKKKKPKKRGTKRKKTVEQLRQLFQFCLDIINIFFSFKLFQLLSGRVDFMCLQPWLEAGLGV